MTHLPGWIIQGIYWRQNCGCVTIGRFPMREATLIVDWCQEGLERREEAVRELEEQYLIRWGAPTYHPGPAWQAYLRHCFGQPAHPVAPWPADLPTDLAMRRAASQIVGEGADVIIVPERWYCLGAWEWLPR